MPSAVRTESRTWFLYRAFVLAGILALWIAATAARISFEEQVLSLAYPIEIAAYRRNVGALLPRFRHASRRPNRRRARFDTDRGGPSA